MRVTGKRNVFNKVSSNSGKTKAVLDTLHLQHDKDQTLEILILNVNRLSHIYAFLQGKIYAARKSMPSGEVVWLFLIEDTY